MLSLFSVALAFHGPLASRVRSSAVMTIDRRDALGVAATLAFAPLAAFAEGQATTRSDHVANE